MRTQIIIDSATLQDVRDLTLAFQRTAREFSETLPSSNLPGPTVGIDGIRMRWTSPHLTPEQVVFFWAEVAYVQEPALEAAVNEQDAEEKEPLAPWEKELLNQWGLDDCVNRGQFGIDCGGRVESNRHSDGDLVVMCENHFNL